MWITTYYCTAEFKSLKSPDILIFVWYIMDIWINVNSIIQTPNMLFSMYYLKYFNNIIKLTKNLSSVCCHPTVLPDRRLRLCLTVVYSLKHLFKTLHSTREKWPTNGTVETQWNSTLNGNPFWGPFTVFYVVKMRFNLLNSFE